MERVHRGEHTVWRDHWTQGAGRSVQVRFVGNGGAAERGAILQTLEPAAPPVAWAKQIHSGRHLPGEEGFCGEGDALITDRTDLALTVITADCVPILVAGETHLAAIHAGWRGIVARIAENTVTALPEAPDRLTAWIGPSIGACCYEVDDDVAARVVAASTPAIATPGPAGKPHLDLIAAVAHQLTDLGITEIRQVERCTRCHPAELASYRREGRGAGRNLAVVWWQAGASPFEMR
jgi:polyphenol oxidase